MRDEAIKKGANTTTWAYAAINSRTVLEMLQAYLLAYEAKT
jgi:hypothetical protein